MEPYYTLPERLKALFTLLFDRDPYNRQQALLVLTPRVWNSIWGIGYTKGLQSNKRDIDDMQAELKRLRKLERPRANGRFLPSFSPGDRVKAVRTCYDGAIQKDTVYTVTAFEPRHRSGIPCLRLEEKPEGAFEAAAFTKAKQTVHPATLKLLKRIEDAGFVKATDIESDTRKMLLEKHFCVLLKRKIGDQYLRVLQLDQWGSYALQHKGVI